MGLLRIGQTIGGVYEVERFLGEGAFAEVYRVKHRFLGRQAMKVFKMVGMTMQETEQMLGEAILLSRIGHPNLVRVFNADITETSRGICGFFTMEYVAGGNLEQFWRSHGIKLVPVETTVEIMTQICRGLSVAHAEMPPIVHRDIKPQNLLIGYDATGLNARVSDFGLAKRVNPLTLMASARGTRSFKAPEALLDWQKDSCAGDVWALGSTLYLLLTDQLPYGEFAEGDSFGEEARFRRPLAPPSRLNVQVDEVLDRIVGKALAVDPAKRYTSAKEMLADLVMWRPRDASAKGASGAKLASSDISKSALGVRTPVDRAAAERMAGEAVKLAKDRARLIEAADLMEEAFNKLPELRERHEYKVKLWRRGIVM